MRINRDIVDKAIDKLTFKDNATVQRWAKFYNMLNTSQKKVLFAKLEVLQADYIVDSMAVLERDIKLIKLGKLRIKKNRLKFYETKEQNPEMSNYEIKDKLVKETIKEDREKRAKKLNNIGKNNINVLRFNK